MDLMLFNKDATNFLRAVQYLVGWVVSHWSASNMGGLKRSKMGDDWNTILFCTAPWNKKLSVLNGFVLNMIKYFFNIIRTNTPQ